MVDLCTRFILFGVETSEKAQGSVSSDEKNRTCPAYNSLFLPSCHLALGIRQLNSYLGKSNSFLAVAAISKPIDCAIPDSSVETPFFPAVLHIQEFPLKTWTHS